MNERTIRILNRVNRDFYRQRGSEFSATRNRGWPGWERVAEELGEFENAFQVKVLDAGCGNGRFGAFLQERLDTRLLFTGVDASPVLLAKARVAITDHRFRWVAADLIEDEWPLSGDFDAISAFGLFHHVPGRARREYLIRQLAELLAPGGRLWVSFWQFAERNRFRSRVVPWQDLRAHRASDHRHQIDPNQIDPHGQELEIQELEQGDYLLAWGDGSALRYCHHTDDREAFELVQASGLAIVDTFYSDGDSGRLNLYYSLGRPSRPGLRSVDT